MSEVKLAKVIPLAPKNGLDKLITALNAQKAKQSPDSYEVTKANAAKTFGNMMSGEVKSAKTEKAEKLSDVEFAQRQFKVDDVFAALEKQLFPELDGVLSERVENKFNGSKAV